MTQYMRDKIIAAGAKDVFLVYHSIKNAVEDKGEDLAETLETYRRNRPEQFWRNA